jgi:2,3-bisphosphoglycerate-independent phosphoglycerate mutase
MAPAHRVLLAILDGWGLRKERQDNAILLAGTPQMERFTPQMPFTELNASGLSVGLPDGQMGNSEVGHTNIGAGRIVYQDLVRINRACEGPGLVENPTLRAAMEKAKADGRALHLIGLIGPGRVHASQQHLEALILAARKLGLTRVFVHAILDGPDPAGL